jgi:hypothetical protein
MNPVLDLAPSIRITDLFAILTISGTDRANTIDAWIGSVMMLIIVADQKWDGNTILITPDLENVEG